MRSEMGNEVQRDSGGEVSEDAPPKKRGGRSELRGLQPLTIAILAGLALGRALNFGWFLTSLAILTVTGATVASCIGSRLVDALVRDLRWDGDPNQAYADSTHPVLRLMMGAIWATPALWTLAGPPADEALVAIGAFAMGSLVPGLIAPLYFFVKGRPVQREDFSLNPFTVVLDSRSEPKARAGEPAEQSLRGSGDD